MLILPELAFADSTHPPYTECPPIGSDTSCGVLITIGPGGSIVMTADQSQGAYDGEDDTLVGVINASGQTVPSIPLTGSGIFSFDDDGLCADTLAPSGCPFGATGYEGPGVTLTPGDDGTGDNGTVTFGGGLAPGATAYFSLEGAPSSLIPTPPQLTTLGTSGISQTQADLHGQVNPMGEDTTWYFEYGPDTNYGTTTDSSNVSGTSPESGSPVQPADVTITDLSPGTTYHYRLVAYNNDGTSYGADQTFRTASPPPPPPRSPSGYAALGDSYSSGEANGPFQQPNTGCDRSKNGAWPELMARSVHLQLRSLLACSGATTHALNHSFNHQRPQLSDLHAMNPPPKLVTITIGGNDLGFVKVLTSCYVASCSLLLRPVETILNHGFAPIMQVVYTAIRTTAPRAHLVVVGYPQLVPSNPLTALRHCPWFKDLVDPVYMRKVTGEVDSAMKKAASAAGVQYVSTLNVLKGHDLCTAHSWVRAIGFTGGSNRGHPLAQGQAAIAAAVAHYVTSHHLN